MAQIERAPEVRGRTIRLIWTEGPTAGKTYEHSFREDGTVDFHEVPAGKEAGAASGAARASSGAGPTPKKPVEYGAFRVADGVFIVSYLSNEGYTLTVALNFADRSMAGFASGAKEWFPLRGTFEIME